MEPIAVGLMYTIRNWRRNVLPILIVGLAGFMVIYSLFLSTGRPYRAELARRAFAGGDLLVYASSLSVPEYGNYLGNEPPVLSFTSTYGLSPMATLASGSARWGTLQSMVKPPNIDALPSIIAAYPNVSAVEPVYLLPAFIASGDRRLPVVLRKRDWSQAPYVSFVETTSEVDDGLILPGWRPQVAGAARGELGYQRFNNDVIGFVGGLPVAAEWPEWQLGDDVALVVPRFVGDQLDYIDPISLTLPVKGLFEFATDTLDWYHYGLRFEGITHEVGRPIDPDTITYPLEQRYLVPLEVSISPALWEQVTDQLGGSPPVLGWTVKLRSLTDLYATVRDLREAVAPAALFSIVDAGSNDELSGEAYIEVPSGDLRATWRGMNRDPLPVFPAAPMWARWAILGLVGLIASILVGGILDIVILEQRREFITLRVLGYSRLQLTLAVFAQVASLVLFGSAITVLIVVLPVLWQASQPGLSVLQVLAVPLRMIVTLILISLGISVILTGNAVRRMLSRPMWEVLRS